MKTAISIPDPLFQAAERLALRLGVSRSELYAKAVEDYLAATQYQGVTERLNAVYRVEPSEIAPEIEALQHKSLGEADW